MSETHPPLTPAWSAAVVASSALGFAVALYLTRLHLDLFYGAGVGTALCDLGGTFDCSAVNSSAESEIFGFPQALLALPVYLVSGGLGLAARRRHDPSYALTLAGLGGLAVAYSAWLAWVSATVIGAWCLFCVALYVVNLSLFGLGVVGARHMGMRRTLAVGSAVKTISGSVVSGTVAFGLLWSGYEYLRDGMAKDAAAAAVATPAAVAAPLAPGAATGGETKKVRLGAARQPIVPPAAAPSRGPADARVTVVELSDFQCPFCKRLAGSLHQLTVEYPKDVRLVYVDYPLNLDCTKAKLEKSMHPSACDAAAAGVCADTQGHFWEMHDLLWEHQGELNRKTYLSLADEIGLDRPAFEACLDAPATRERIVSGTELGASLDVIGTPTFYVNGRQMAGGQPIEVLRAVVDAELAGNTAALDLDIAVDTETTGVVSGPATVTVAGVTIDAFEASLDGKAAQSRPGVAPARGLSWYEASAACEAAGKRLCTEREWLTACSGVAPVDADGNGVASDDTLVRRYGYGDARLSGVCADSRNPDAVGELLTGNHPRCGTPEGVYDLVGGVKEWVGLTPSTAALKGGSYSSRESARCGYFRDDIAADTQDPANGLRCCSGPPDPAPPAVVAGRDVGEKLAPLSLPTRDGATWSSASLAGKAAIVTFWASWCGPCQKEMPALAKVYQAHKKEGLEVVGISVDTDEKKLDTWLGAHAMPFGIVRDPGGEVMKGFPNRGLPTTLWIRKDGTIRLRTTGVPPGGEKRIEELVNELLGSG